MHMTKAEEVQNIIGRTAVDRDGKKVGKIGQIYLGDDSGSPRWVTIGTGLFGTNESFSPSTPLAPEPAATTLAHRTPTSRRRGLRTGSPSIRRRPKGAAQHRDSDRKPNDHSAASQGAGRADH